MKFRRIWELPSFDDEFICSRPDDGAQLLLERPGDQLLDLLRPDAGVVHADRDRRLRDVGQEIDRQPDEGDAADAAR